MAKYVIKTNLKNAPKIIRLIKAAKNGNKIEVRTKPIIKMQEEVLTEVMGGFFNMLSDIKTELNIGRNSRG